MLYTTYMYNSGNQIGEGERFATCSTHGCLVNSHLTLSEKHKWKKTFRRHCCRFRTTLIFYKQDVTSYIKFNLLRRGDQWLALVNTVMKLGVPQMVSWSTLSFSGTVLCGVRPRSAILSPRDDFSSTDMPYGKFQNIFKKCSQQRQFRYFHTVWTWNCLHETCSPRLIFVRISYIHYKQIVTYCALCINKMSCRICQGTCGWMFFALK
jgi:hypothetical protein